MLLSPHKGPLNTADDWSLAALAEVSLISPPSKMWRNACTQSLHLLCPLFFDTQGDNCPGATLRCHSSNVMKMKTHLDHRLRVNSRISESVNRICLSTSRLHPAISMAPFSSTSESLSTGGKQRPIKELITSNRFHDAKCYKGKARDSVVSHTLPLIRHL